MSSVNFLKVEYRIEAVREDIACGIMDGENDLPAYTTIDKTRKWNAVISNPRGKRFQFVPVDYNIIITRENGEKESSCDGMLLVDEDRLIAFIELKDVKSGGFPVAIKQLETTVKLFLENHNYEQFRTRLAYAANIAHPGFHYNMKDEMEKFRKLKFRLLPTAKIDIK